MAIIIGNIIYGIDAIKLLSSHTETAQSSRKCTVRSTNTPGNQQKHTSSLKKNACFMIVFSIHNSCTHLAVHQFFLSFSYIQSYACSYRFRKIQKF